MEPGFSFKELYEVALKATYPIEVGDKSFEEGETIAIFDEILLANFSEIKQTFTAKGGYDDRSLIFWDNSKEIRITLTQGVFSKTQFALLSNAKLFHNKEEKILINKRLELETNEEGMAELEHSPQGKIFVYNKNTGEKIETYTLNGRWLSTGKAFLEIFVDYQYFYSGSSTTLKVGESLTEGFLSLTGKTRIKDDTTGLVKTGIINIPKLKLMSDLSIRLGKEAIPLVGKLDAIALPVGGKGDKKIMEIIFLDDDVDSDM